MKITAEFPAQDCA